MVWSVDTNDDSATRVDAGAGAPTVKIPGQTTAIYITANAPA